jgi:tRNA(fMet)-specific endonuclease VapC
MKYMLDTNICIYTIKHKPESVINNFMSHKPEDLCISSITYAELMHGVEKSQAVEKNRLAILLFLSPITILNFGDKAAGEYGRVRAALERKGTPIGPLDMLIAGHAKSEGLILVTNNTREFKRVDGLALEDWVQNSEGVTTYD